jgi:hypothetical protein
MSEQTWSWRFASDHASLIVYHDGAKVAQFVGGAFETADPAVAEALRSHELCREIAVEPAPAEAMPKAEKPARAAAHK